jgi:hypothetical protein
MCRQRGIEMTDMQELPHLARAAEIGRAMRGGDKIDSKEAMRYIAEPGSEPIPLAETLRKSGKMRDIMQRIEVGYENWSDRGANSSVEMARKGAQAASEGFAVTRTEKNPVDAT